MAESISPEEASEIKECDMHVPPKDTFWSTFESSDSVNQYGCAHGWEFRWLKNFKVLGGLARWGEVTRTEHRNGWARSRYPFIHLSDDELFGPQWRPYLRDSMGHDSPELIGRWPEWFLRVHT
jgi:hypothetical protein